jgi:hypothetical protein
MIGLGLFGNKIKNRYFNFLSGGNIIYIFIFGTLLLTLILILIKYNVKLTYCIDEETAKKLAETMAKKVNPSVSLQTQGVNVNVPSNLLNNVGYYGGLSATIVGGLSVGAGLAAKSGSPLIKVGFALGTGVAATGLYTLGTITNKRIVSPSNNTNDGNDSSYPTSSMIGNGDNDLFTAQDAIDFLNTHLMLHGLVLYLLFTLMIFFMGFMILKDKTSLN